jgi:hypothetical protein
MKNLGNMSCILPRCIYDIDLDMIQPEVQEKLDLDDFPRWLPGLTAIFEVRSGRPEFGVDVAGERIHIHTRLQLSESNGNKMCLLTVPFCTWTSVTFKSRSNKNKGNAECSICPRL